MATARADWGAQWLRASHWAFKEADKLMYIFTLNLYIKYLGLYGRKWWNSVSETTSISVVWLYCICLCHLCIFICIDRDYYIHFHVDKHLKLCAASPLPKQLDLRSRKNILMMQLWQQWSAVQRDTLSEIWVQKPDWLILHGHTNDQAHSQTTSNNPSTTRWCVKLHHSGAMLRSVWGESDRVCQTSRNAFCCWSSSSIQFMVAGRCILVKTIVSKRQRVHF